MGRAADRPTPHQVGVRPSVHRGRRVPLRVRTYVGRDVAAARLRSVPTCAEDWEGKIPYYKAGAALRFDVDEVVATLEREALRAPAAARVL